MAETFFHDPEVLAQASDRLGEAGGTLSDAFTELKSVLDEHDGCWGDDEIGKAFEENYTEPANKLRESSDNVTAGMDNLSKELSGLREEFLAQDQGNASNVDNTNA